MERATEQFAGRFGDWDPLGEGAAARLYRVRDRWTGHLAALKVATPESADALVHEFRLLSRLRHPCLVESSDLVRDGGDLAHLLEYVPALDPRSLWERGGEAAVWAVLTQALRGLTYLHRRGYVHGDVSPGNLLVWRDGEAWRAKVADLGLTLPADRAARAGVTGTPGFMAPETARGEGLSPASDLYGLAATAVVWIDGRDPWDGLGPGQVLKRLASGTPAPVPRRRISPELEKLLAGLGAADAGARSAGDWTDLRRPERWGPPGLAGTVVGLDEVIGDWGTWVGDAVRGQVVSLVLAGRRGTGRHTVLRALARRLVADGWTGLWDLPLDAVRDWLATTAADPDLVQIARELDRRFAGRDVVMVWPEASGEPEARLFRAFVTARDGAGEGVRTLVLKQTGLQRGPDAEWLRNVSRCRTEEWSGVGAEPLGDLARDLFPPEDGYEDDLAVDSFNTPLAIEQAKRRRVLGGASEAETLSVAEEVGLTWSGLSPAARDALTVLAYGRGGWKISELAHLLDWDPDRAAAVAGELERSRLVRHRFDSEEPRQHVTDWMTKEAIRGLDPAFPECGAVDAYPAGGEALPLDLGFATSLVQRGRWPEAYLHAATESALDAARYEDVLALRKVVEDRGLQPSFGLLGLFLRAAQGLGKYPEQEAILNRMLEAATGMDALAVRKHLGQVLVGLRRWQASVEQFRVIEESPDASETDRIWAGLQRAGSLWQGGRFEDADAVYQTLQEKLHDSMREEWLRFSVGRAREYGQRGNMVKVKEYLDLARRKAGEELCEGDALYLHTTAGLLMEKGTSAAASPLLQRARSRASESREWNDFVMISSRASSVLYDMGDMWQAARAAGEAVAVSEALRSEQLAQRSSIFIAYPEVQLGNLGSSLRRANQAIKLAEDAGDENQTLQGLRLLAFVSANAGWETMLADSCREITEIALRIGERECVAFSHFCVGLLRIGQRNWSMAREALLQSLEEMQALGKVSSPLRIRLMLAWTDFKMGSSAAIKELGSREDLSQYPFLLTPWQLIHAEMEGIATIRIAGILQDLWETGRVMDLIDWGPTLMRFADSESRFEVRKKVLSAVQRVADSMNSADLRRDFLAFDKVKLALSSLQQ